MKPNELRRANRILHELNHLLPIAFITGSMEKWSALYAEAYILKLRAMR